MTRDEFMKHAAEEIDAAFRGQKNRMMNLVEQAWAEGKRNAETGQIAEIVNGMVEEIQKRVQPVVIQQTTPTWPPYTFTCNASGSDVAEAHYEAGSTNRGDVCMGWHPEGDEPVCWGTREKDVCSCGGDRRRCDFYREVRASAGI